jgi:hypothetical protein
LIELFANYMLVVALVVALLAKLLKALTPTGTLA